MNPPGSFQILADLQYFEGQSFSAFGRVGVDDRGWLPDVGTEVLFLIWSPVASSGPIYRINILNTKLLNFTVPSGYSFIYKILSIYKLKQQPAAA